MAVNASLCSSPALADSPPTTGRIEAVTSLHSEYVAARRVDVWLPPGYPAGSARYPVLYMHDGQNLFDAATAFGGVEWGVDETLVRLIAAGQARAAIVVGVWNTPKRLQEYMPEKPVASAPAGRDPLAGMRPDAREGPLLSDAYLRFLVEELKPWIDGRYATRPERESTSVMGSSMGGLVSLYALIEYPAVFGGAACLSTHWPAGDGIVVDWAARALPKPGGHRLYFDFGTLGLDAEYEPFQARMDAALRAAGYRPGQDFVSYKFERADHNERSWRERLEVPLAFLLRPEPSSGPGTARRNHP
jgi:predicted alpha/beta superfamily hydrolase